VQDPAATYLYSSTYFCIVDISKSWGWKDKTSHETCFPILSSWCFLVPVETLHCSHLFSFDRIHIIEGTRQIHACFSFLRNSALSPPGHPLSGRTSYIYTYISSIKASQHSIPRDSSTHHQIHLQAFSCLTLDILRQPASSFIYIQALPHIFSTLPSLFFFFPSSAFQHPSVDFTSRQTLKLDVVTCSWGRLCLGHHANVFRQIG